MRALGRLFGKALGWGLAAGAAVAGDWTGAPVFETPRLQRELAAAFGRLAAGDGTGAETELKALSRRFPNAAAPQAALALSAAAQGAEDLALRRLGAAVDRGYAGAAAMAALPPFAALADDPRLAALVARVPPAQREPEPRPAPVADGIAPVEPGNVRFDPASGLLEALFEFGPPPPSRRSVFAVEAEGEAARLLAAFARRGAAGHAGDLYDNRDRGHSRLDLSRFPTLAAVRYGEAAQAAGVDYGPNVFLRFPGPVIGNSSTAVTGGAEWRSLGRLALTSPGGPNSLYAHYVANHLYIFPEHRDHDEDQGDLFPANTPYILVSQGSSGSDQPLMRAAAFVYAAFRADTKALLRERGLVVATAQMVLRRTLAGVETDEDYMSGRAHPSAFRGEDLRPLAAMRLANALEPGSIPPMARIAVAAEFAPGGRGDLFADGRTETLFDTPAAAARTALGTNCLRRYVLDASATADPNGRPLRFHWRLLRGDSARASVRPLDPEGRRAEALIGWHEALPVPGRPEIRSNRVDVAVFADNGAALSAPAFFSLSFPPGETRACREDGAPLSVAYPGPEVYADPVLYPVRGWRDDYAYAPDGRLLGWTRRRGAEESRFTRDGLRVTASDAAGRPLGAEAVAYAAETRDGVTTIREVPTGERFVYRYDGPDDPFGWAEPARD